MIQITAKNARAYAVLSAFLADKYEQDACIEPFAKRGVSIRLGGRRVAITEEVDRIMVYYGFDGKPSLYRNDQYALAAKEIRQFLCTPVNIAA